VQCAECKFFLYQLTVFIVTVCSVTSQTTVLLSCLVKCVTIYGYVIYVVVKIVNSASMRD